MPVPEDVLIDILSSLPAESVIRFRCVSKHWSFLTQNPDFIAAHLSRSNSNDKDDDDYDDVDDDFSLVCSLGDEFTGKLFCISGADFRVRKEVEIPLKVRDRDNQQDKYWPELYGSCNGILCVANDSNGNGAGIALWNPAIGQVKLVPLIGRSWPLECDWGSFCCTGFGYDSKTSDYKILTLIAFEDDERGVHIRDTYLYSLSTDSWKVLDPFPLIGSNQSECINGVFYWPGHETQAIISFDMVEEKFHELAAPTIHFFSWSLANLKGSLAFCACDHRDGNENDLHIWVLNTDGKSWTRLTKITPSVQLSHPTPLGQRKHGELIFKDSNAIILFDPQTQETRNLGNLVNIPYAYKASLVTLKGAVELEEHGFCNMILDPYFLHLFGSPQLISVRGQPTYQRYANIFIRDDLDH